MDFSACMYRVVAPFHGLSASQLDRFLVDMPRFTRSQSLVQLGGDLPEGACPDARTSQPRGLCFCAAVVPVP